MKPKHALVALVGVLAVLSFILAFLDARGVAEPKSLQVGSTLAFSVLTFYWFWLDSEARLYKRSPFLSISIVALGLIAVPYYLVRSRPDGERFKAFCRFLGFVLLLIAALIIGSFLGALLGQYA